MDDRILKSPPKISKVEVAIRRPLWSVLIPVFNCARFLPDTLRSVLVQAPDESEMEIIVVDDYSTDANVEKLVQQVGRGRIKYFRQNKNVGSLINFYTCLEISKGKLIHLLHGDDLVKPGYYKTIEKLFAIDDAIGGAYTRYAYIDDEGKYLYNHEEEQVHTGILDNWLDRISERQRIQYCAITVKREVYEDLGGFYGVEYGEDWEMWVRIATKYKVAYSPAVMALYRKHLSSISGRSFVTGKNMDELQQVMQSIASYLPDSKKEFIRQKSAHFYSHYAINVAKTLWFQFKNRNGAITQMRAAWKMQKDVYLLLKILKLYTRITLNI